MRLFLGISGIIALLFLLFPTWDITISSQFYQPDAGFIYRDHWLVELVDGLAKPLTILIAGGSVLGLVLTLLFRPAPGWLPSWKVLLFLFASLSIGPGLITHNLFKNQWDRARPSQVRIFGGEQWFTPPFVMTNRCEDNCSFVSGHAALGFFLLTFGLLTKRRKFLVYTAAATFGTVMAGARVVQGNHFFSDVLFAGVLVYAVSYTLYHYVFFREAYTNSSSRSVIATGNGEAA